MLYDRIKWHYDRDIPWQDEDAVRALIPAGQQQAVSRASGFRYDVTDHAEFQRPDPQWKPPPGLRGMVVRCTDGVYREPAFATDFRIMDGLLQQGLLDYVMWYVLPNPNVSNQRMVDAIAGQIKDSGVTWGRKGHGFSIDDEPTPYHAQVTGQTMVDLRNALQDIYQREELHYVGLYNGNYGFIENQGWKLWAPWPTSNGALPSWTTNLVMQQWGVASAGEVSGFPTKPVDVNHIWDQAVLDELTGRTVIDDLEALLSADDVKAQINDIHYLLTQGYPLEDIHAAVAQDGGGNPAVRGNRGTLQNLDRLFRVDYPLADVHKAVAEDANGNPAAGPGVLQAVLANTSGGGVDVEKLAAALGPKLGVDAKAVARAILEALGTFATGGTPGGGQ